MGRRRTTEERPGCRAKSPQASRAPGAPGRFVREVNHSEVRGFHQPRDSKLEMRVRESRCECNENHPGTGIFSLWVTIPMVTPGTSWSVKLDLPVGRLRRAVLLTNET